MSTAPPSIDNSRLRISGDPRTVTIEDALEEVCHGPWEHIMLLITGLALAADALEILSLSFVSVVLADSWDLSPVQSSLIGFMTFSGSVFGGPVGGGLADSIGRRKSLIAMLAVVSCAGFLSCFCSTLTTFCIARGIVGFGVGGVLVTVDIIMETTAPSRRSLISSYLMMCWSVASVGVNLLAWACLESCGWRVFLFFVALPSTTAVLLACTILPETPLWLYVNGREGDALGVLRDIAGKNGCKFEAASLKSSQQKVSKMSTLCTKKYSTRFLLVLCLFFCVNFFNYGIIMSGPYLFHTEEGAAEATGPRFHYKSLTFSGFADVLASLLFALLADTSRRINVLGCHVFGAIACFVISLDIGIGPLTVMLNFIARFASSYGFPVVWIYAGELFPTCIRGFTHSSANAFGKLGGGIVQFAVSGSLRMSAEYLLFGGVGLVIGLIVVCLPETAGRSLEGLESTSGDGDSSSETETSESDDSFIGGG
eukprot:TRINITY_DN6341_c0_g1_i6.p1 TRINITY_DN6341_c0_g1~~TRINITY_DN6341_c0_g1_i6.p1  ORF type:complete len:483 (-),score=42.34 TRINITY_DN6341_c0_g1_i6:11-1459(-)